jgi:hypothetical protein
VAVYQVLNSALDRIPPIKLSSWQDIKYLIDSHLGRISKHLASLLALYQGLNSPTGRKIRLRLSF